MDDIPRGFPRDLFNRIRSGLLRVESKHRDGIDSNVCLKESYDVYAGRLQEAGWTLDETLLTESIPAWVFQWAVARNWLPYPPLRVRRNNAAPTNGKYSSSHEPVPEDELTVPFGCYKVTDWYKADVIKRFGSRISHWQAEALDPISAGRIERSRRTGKAHRASPDNAADDNLNGVMNLVELPAKFQSSFEAAKAKAELEYATRAERFPHHPQFADPALHFPKLIQDVFFAFCTEARNASRAGVWSVAQTRKASDAALPVICDFYFVRECGSDSNAKKSRFRVTFTRTVVHDPQWKRHNLDLAELAERKSIPSGGAKKNRRVRGTKNGRPARTKLTAATSESRDLHAMVDAFLQRCNEQSKLKVKLIRKHICLAVGHKKPRQFQYWQAQSKKASKADEKNFLRILAMTPDEFVAVLSHKGILS
jgi:hypothetical protein